MADFGWWQEQAQPGVMCTVCFEVKARELMKPADGEPGVVWDVCLECAPKAGL